MLAFAFGGKSSHEAGDSDWVVLLIAWPFALGTVIAHCVLVGRGRDTTRVRPAGVVVLAATYVVGMALRVATSRGIAVAFLFVAIVFLGVTMLGWRAVAGLVSGRRSR